MILNDVLTLIAVVFSVYSVLLCRNFSREREYYRNENRRLFGRVRDLLDAWDKFCVADDKPANKDKPAAASAAPNYCGSTETTSSTTSTTPAPKAQRKPTKPKAKAKK